MYLIISNNTIEHNNRIIIEKEPPSKPTHNQYRKLISATLLTFSMFAICSMRVSIRWKPTIIHSGSADNHAPPTRATDNRAILKVAVIGFKNRLFFHESAPQIRIAIASASLSSTTKLYPFSWIAAIILSFLAFPFPVRCFLMVPTGIP